MKKIGELYNVSLSGLLPRVEKSKAFKTGVEHLDNALESLPPHARNSMLNTGVGVEIEVENCPGTYVANWNVDNDGSLRNSGFEYKTQYGHRIHHLWKSLGAVEAQLTSQSCVFSERTSVHVHIDVRDLTPDQLLSFVILYIITEPMLFRYAGDKRKHNIFCVPFSNSTLIRASKEPEGYEKIIETINNASKYTALNLASIREFGTVEFRHMEGNCSQERIFIWSVIIGLMKYYAKNVPMRTLSNIIFDLKAKSYYMSFLESIFFGFINYLSFVAPEMSRSLSNSKILLPEEI